MSDEEMKEELEKIMKFGLDENSIEGLKGDLNCDDIDQVKTSFIRLLAHSVFLTMNLSVTTSHLEQIASGILDEEEMKASAQIALEKTTLRQWRSK